MNLKPILPFEPVAADRCPDGEDWVAQIKWDGVRMLTYFDGSSARLINRRLNDRTLQYPEFADPRMYCDASSFVLDGEFIAFSDAGTPSFNEIMKRDSLRSTVSIERAIRQTPVTYMIFDLLYVDGGWVTGRPLFERQQLLSSIIRPQPNVQLVPNVADPHALLEVVKQHAMEGIVCKQRSSTYAAGGKDKRWLKIKLFRDLYAVIGGVTLRGNTVNSLLLGLYAEGGRFLYIGHAGTGKLSQADWRALTERIQPFLIDRKPFANEPERSKDALWVKPSVTVKVQFLEWTPHGTMRHPSIQSLAQVPIEACIVPT